MVSVSAFLGLLLAAPLAAAIAAGHAASSPYGGATLVLYDERVSPDFQSHYSRFLSLIGLNGGSYTLQAADSASPVSLFAEDGTRAFDNVAVFPSRARSLTSAIDAKQLTSFAENGGNFLFVSSNLGTQTDVAIFLNALGIYPSPKGYKFIDYHAEGSYSDDGAVSQVSSPIFFNDNVFPGIEPVDTLAYSNGSVALLDNSEYLVPLLKASDTSITYNTDKGYVSHDSTWHSGSQGFLMTGYQARNNARVVWVGSADVFSDAAANDAVADYLVKWAFQVNGVIRADSFSHVKTDADGQPLDDQSEYKVKDYSHFEVGISAWDGSSWVPYEASDVQLEFVMLDPYYRLTLPFETTRGDDAVYGTIFQIPDQHGMFTFKVDYKRPGLSYIDNSTVVPVRHLANDEYPRSWEITNSWVYAASFFSVVAAWLLFVVFYIYSGQRPQAPVEKKTN